MPNLQKKRIFDPKTGKWVKLRVSTSALRTLTKKGQGAPSKNMRAA